MQDTTNIINMSEYINNPEIRMLAMHGKSMLLMYDATGEQRYLDRARQDYDKITSLRSGFMRPIGAIIDEAA